MFVIFTLFFFLPSNAESHSFQNIKLPSLGSEANAFDSDNIGPYTGLNDGRIVRYEGPNKGFINFAITSPNRSSELCDGKNGENPKIGWQCGRPLGLEINHKTGELYVVDAFRGLLVVGRGGEVAAEIGGWINGRPFDFPDGIAIDQTTGQVYFTDIGPIFSKTNNMTEILLSGDTKGKLLKYDPVTRRMAVVLTGLAVPAGVVVSRDGSFVLVTEYIACRITRFWVKGPKAGSSEIFVELPGNPDNIKRTRTGDFWVAVNIQKVYPKLIVFPLGQKINALGQILETVNFYAEYNATYVTEVQEHDGSLYIASVYTDFVGIYRRLMC